MRLEHIRIDNFRGLSQVDMPFSRFGCLIGENNAGKSSVFQALNMFLELGLGRAQRTSCTLRVPIRIQLTFAEHRGRRPAASSGGPPGAHRPEIVDGRLTLARIYRGRVRAVRLSSRRCRSDSRYQRSALDEVLKPKMSDEEACGARQARLSGDSATLLLGRSPRSGQAGVGRDRRSARGRGLHVRRRAAEDGHGQVGGWPLCRSRSTSRR